MTTTATGLTAVPATAAAIAIAVLIYRTTSRRVRQIITTDSTGQPRDTATLIGRRDAAWRYLHMTGHYPLARAVIEEDAILHRLTDRRAHREDTGELFTLLARIRAQLRQQLATLDQTVKDIP